MGRGWIYKVVSSWLGENKREVGTSVGVGQRTVGNICWLDGSNKLKEKISMSIRQFEQNSERKRFPDYVPEMEIGVCSYPSAVVESSDIVESVLGVGLWRVRGRFSAASCESRRCLYNWPSLLSLAVSNSSD